MAEFITIRMSSRSLSLISDIAKSSPSLSRKLQEISRNAVNEASKLATNSYRSAVPVDTKELRDQFITTLDQASLTNLEATVGVRDGFHLGRDKKSIDVNELVKILNDGVNKKTGGVLTRSQESVATSPFSSVSGATKGWIELGEKGFLNNIQKYLDQRNFNY